MNDARQWLDRNKWFVVACLFLGINFYGVLGRRYVTAPGDSRADVDASKDARPEAVRPATIATNPAAPAVDVPVALTHFTVHSPPFENAWIRAEFSRQVDVGSLRRALGIDPATEVSVEETHDWRNGSKVYEIRGGFKKGARHSLTIRQGVRAVSGDARLDSDITRSFTVPDADPDIRIRLQGRYLSPKGALSLPLESVNLDAYELKAARLVPHNLVQFAMREGGHYESYYGRAGDAISVPTQTRTFRVSSERNAVRQHNASLRELLPEDPRGAWWIDLVALDRTKAGGLFVVTDTGIGVKQSGDELLVWANSIHTLDAVTGAVVQAWSSASELIAEAHTDAQGLAVLPMDASTEPFLVSVSNGNDLSFLSLKDARLDPDGGAGLVPYLREGHEAFVYTDRGVYRPGEATHVRGVVRGPGLESPGKFPLELHVVRPDGRVHSRRQAMLSESGTVEFEVPWAEYDATGRYRLALKTPGGETALGETSVAVEEFAPPRIEVRLTSDKTWYANGEDARATVRARYLYGAPAAGNPVSLRMELQPRGFHSTNFPDHVFGDAEKDGDTTSAPVGAGRLNPDGSANFNVPFPARRQPPALLRALLTATVMDQGGRTVTAYSGIELHPYPFYIGLRAAGLRSVSPGETRRIEIVLAEPDGAVRRERRALEVSLESVTWSTAVSQDGRGRYRYQSIRRLTRVHHAVVETGEDGIAQCDIAPGFSSDYLLRVSHPETGASTSIPFYAGGPHDRWLSQSMEQPGRLELAWDKERYRPGETAVLTVKAPFAGKALLTLEQDRVRYRDVRTMEGNTLQFQVAVTSNLWPNAHASVSVIREVKPTKMQAVYRACGSIPLLLDDSHTRLRIDIGAPEVIRPLSRLEIELRVTDPDGRGQLAEVAVAAVDEGICMLTAFKTPAPADFFAALRENAVTTSDLYAQLLPEVDPETADCSAHTGGDVAHLLRGRLNPVRSRRFKPVALWQGGVMTDANGVARIGFDVPEFSGEIRLMAVAVAGKRFGSAGKAVTVRRPFTIMASMPRFLAPGDTCLLSVELHNASGRDGEAVLEVAGRGPLQVQTDKLLRINLPDGQRTSAAFTVQALDGYGTAAIELTGTLGNERMTDSIELPVRPAAPPIVIHGALRVPAGERCVVTMPGDWLPGSESFQVRFSGLPSASLTGGMAYLIGYPYGCLEQTVSAAFPMLYLKDLPPDPEGALVIGDLSSMVLKGIDRTIAMQRGNGGFGYWPDSGAMYEWGSIYAMHFLAEARGAGYPVPDDRLEAGARHLGEMLTRPVKSADDPATDAWRCDAALRAYACYALAAAGRPRHDWAERLREQAEFLDLDSRLYLILALASGGRRRDAWNELQALDGTPHPDVRHDGGALVSPARTPALKLAAWVELAPDDVRIPDMVRHLESFMRNGAWRTTQENAAALMAIGRYLRHTTPLAQDFTGWMEQSGRRVRVDSKKAGAPTAATGAPFTVINEGPGALYCVWQAHGIPVGESVSEHDRGLSVRRATLTLDETPAPEDVVPQGEPRIVRLTIDTHGEHLDNLVIDDLLPAGLEIENANLATAEVAEWAKKKTTLPVRHVDVRDDRIVIFAEAFRGKREFHYAVRAVTPGRYVRPAVSASSMYNPDMSSRHGAGQIEVPTGD